MKLIEVRGDSDALATLATRIFTAQAGRSALTNLVSITPNGKRLIVLAPEPMLAHLGYAFDLMLKRVPDPRAQARGNGAEVRP